ncbi:MAG TPA: hypothetical protein DIC45_05380 [Comamonadaceae bacterium]|nr:hypothetical protein [Comamonadaceae bacterium]
MRRNLRLLGGFAGTESALDERPTPPDPALTVLDGENRVRVLGLDGTGAGGGPITPATLIEGLTLTRGSSQDGGSGLYCNGRGVGGECSPTLRHVALRDHYADDTGAALIADGRDGGASRPTIAQAVFSGNRTTRGGAFGGFDASPELTDVLFHDNHADMDGGAFYHEGGSPTLTRVRFSDNDAAQDGGALYTLGDGGTGAAASLRIENSLFVGNSAARDGGALYHGGLRSGVAALEIVSTTFQGNRAERDGGALLSASDGLGGAASLRIANATFHANSAGGKGGAVASSAQHLGVVSPVIRGSTFTDNVATSGGAVYGSALNGASTSGLAGSILWDNTSPPVRLAGSAQANVRHSIVQGSITGTGNLAVDPMLEPLADNGGFAPTRLPAPGSPALDMVDCAELALPTDQRGAARPQGAQCDVGAVERRTTSISLAVTVTGTGAVRGLAPDCTGGTCEYAYLGETAPLHATLIAVPDSGERFTGWSGDCAGATATCTVALDGARSVTAAFARDPASTRTIGGSVSGLIGAGLVLRNNGGDDLAIGADGPFVFATPVAQGGAYAVSVLAQPTGQTCSVANGSGTASADVSDVRVECRAQAGPGPGPSGTHAIPTLSTWGLLLLSALLGVFALRRRI